LKLARSRSRKLVKFPVVGKFPVAVAEVAENTETVKRSLLRTSPSRNLEWMGSWYSAMQKRVLSLSAVYKNTQKHTEVFSGALDRRAHRNKRPKTSQF
jgi:hypothetical protein